MSRDGDEAEEIGEVKCEHATADGLKIVGPIIKELTGENYVWIPKVAVHDDSECFDDDENNEGILVVKRWFARSRRWV